MTAMSGDEDLLGQHEWGSGTGPSSWGPVGTTGRA